MIFFFFNDTATTEIYTLSLHDALPILTATSEAFQRAHAAPRCAPPKRRSEEHTSELQSQSNLVCRLLLEKKKTTEAQQLQVIQLRADFDEARTRLYPIGRDVAADPCET